MESKDKKKIGIIFFIILVIAIVLDLTQENIGEDGVILRNPIGEADEEIALMLELEGYEEVYEYLLEVKAMRVTEEQAEGYFTRAISEIDEEFQEMGSVIPLKEAYQAGLVAAEWSFEPWNVINADGSVVQEKIPEEGLVVTAGVTLSCGEYQKMYQFSFELEPRELSVEERVFNALEAWIASELQKEGEQELRLPEELEGVALSWTKKQDSLFVKILFLEAIALFVLWYLQKKKQEEEKKKLDESIEMDYPDVVEQLALLLGAGMTIRQAWNRIATRYSDKRQKNQVSEKPVFEKIVQMNRRLVEGESESSAYQMFADEIGLMSYQRLIRSLLRNMEKGSTEIYVFLDQESHRAYEQRIHYAKKLGEEASTRMLLPLMLMMFVVMAIAMLPAIVNFSI